MRSETLGAATPSAIWPADVGAVLMLAARGWQLFPCVPRSKKPCVKEWQKAATADPARIRAWHAEYPDCNWAAACGPVSGFWAMDCDVKPCSSCSADARHVDGKATLKGLMAEHGSLPATLITRTCHGGQYLFKYPSNCSIRNSNDGKKLGDGLDIRGDGGYVIVPPSIHPEGTPYRFVKPDAPLVDAPEWLVQRATSREAEALPEVVSAVSADVIPKGKGEPAKFTLAIKLLKSGCSRKNVLAAVLALDAISEHRLGEHECRRKVNEWAGRYASGEALAERGRFELVTLGSLLRKAETPVEWIWEGRLVAGTVSAVVAKPKVGKSTFARNLCLAVARGKNFLGLPTRQGECIYLALEERESEIRTDFAALGADGTEPILIHAAPTPADGMFALLELIRERKPRLVVIDPLFRLARVKDESAYAEIYTALGPLIDIARESGTHLMLLHHSGKSMKTDAIDAPLGSTAIGGAVCTLIVLRRNENYRSIQTVQRVPPDLPECVLEFDTETRQLSLGAEKGQADIRVIEVDILDYLQTGGCAKTEPEIDERVEGKTGPKRKALRALVEQGKVTRDGSGKKGAPFTYRCSFSCFQGIAGTREQESEKPHHTRMKSEAILVPDSPALPVLVPEREMGEL